MGATPEGEADQALRDFVAGDRSAFETLVRAHQDRVYRLALGLLGSREDAHDATQEVFLRAYRTLPGWRFEARLTTWLHAVTVNVVREERRRRGSEWRKRSRFGALVAPLLPWQRPDEAARAEAEELGLLVAALPPRQREVVVLRVYEGLSVGETAAALAIPPGTVKSNLFKALRSLRRRLAAEGPGADSR